MAFHDYIVLNGKKYKVRDAGEGSFQPAFEHPKTYDVGLTGLSIIQDFTVETRYPRSWRMTLRVFQTTPWPDSSFGVFEDLLTAYRLPYVNFTEHDDTQTHVVGIEGVPIVRIPRTGANIEGHCYGVDYIDVTLIKIFQEV